MTIAVPLTEPFSFPEEDFLAPYQDAASSLRDWARAAGADNYVVVEHVCNRIRIVASDWTYDDVAAFGTEAIARLLASPFATFPGSEPRGVHPLMLGAQLGNREIATLRARRDTELFIFKLLAGEDRYGAILSTRMAGHIGRTAAARAQLQCCHLLSELAGERTAPVYDNPLSHREVECLRWVAEGKTTEEVALILGVSANTINSYIAQSINKLAASNRAMATAIALRQGLI